MREVKSVSHPYPQENILENWLSFVLFEREQESDVQTEQEYHFSA